jgi:hypothetical protein
MSGRVPLEQALTVKPGNGPAEKRTCRLAADSQTLLSMDMSIERHRHALRGAERDKGQPPWDQGPNPQGTLDGGFGCLIPVSKTPSSLTPAKLVEPVDEGRGRRTM